MAEKPLKIFKSVEEIGLGKECWAIVRAWLARGDGVAVYENCDLGHPELGHRKFCSFGSKEAQLEGCDRPPDRMPDIGAINWRYMLVGYIPRRKEKEA